MYPVAEASELASMGTSAAADIENGGGIRRVLPQQPSNVRGFQRVILVAVQKIVVPRVGRECAQANTFRTAAATRCIWSSVSAMPLGR